MDIIKKLSWRYAVQKFDPTKKVSDKDFDVLIEALRLSPSSFGLQPWKFVVVKDPAIRQKLHEAAYNQSKVIDASHFIVLCSMENITPELADRYVESVAKARNVSMESLAALLKSRRGFIEGSTKEELSTWASNQVFIALGVLLTTAAAMNIDAGPMGGFDDEKFDEILGLKELGLKSRVACAIGYRAADDHAANHPKARFDKPEVVIEI